MTVQQYSARGEPGGYYLYNAAGLFIGVAASPSVPFRFAPKAIAAVIREDVEQRRKADRKDNRKGPAKPAPKPAARGIEVRLTPADVVILRHALGVFIAECEAHDGEDDDRTFSEAEERHGRELHRRLAEFLIHPPPRASK